MMRYFKEIARYRWFTSFHIILIRYLYVALAPYVPIGAANDTLSSVHPIYLIVPRTCRTPSLVVYPSTMVVLLTVSDCVCLEDFDSDSLF